MIMKMIELYVEFRSGMISFTDDDFIEFDEVNKFTIDELDAIVTEAKAFREYRESRMPKFLKIEDRLREDIPGEVEEYGKKDAASHCGKSLVYTKEMLINSLHKEYLDQTLVTKVDDKDNNINKVIDMNVAVANIPQSSFRKKKADVCNNPQVLIEVPEFLIEGCTYHKCNNSQYWITTDGRIKIDPPEPYDVYIYTAIAEIQRLRAMTAAELMVFYKAYEKQTYANKRYALRMFLFDIKDKVFPPAVVEPTVTPEPTADSPAPEGAERYWNDPAYLEPEATPTPTDPYVLKTRMSKKTAALWEKFADPAKVKQ